jgi:hypothetical protein
MTDLSHPKPEVIIERLHDRIKSLRYELEILQAKYVQLQGFMLDNGYASEYEAWRVGKRIQREEVC